MAESATARPAGEAMQPDAPAPAGAEALWRALVDKTLKNKRYEELAWQSLDGFALEPLPARVRPAAPLPRAVPGPFRVFSRVDHPDPEMAQALALADLEGGADGLTLDFSSLPQDVGELDAVLSGVALDAIALRLEPSADGPAQAQALATVIDRRGHAPEALTIDFALAPGAEAVAKALMRKRFSGPFISCDTRPFHDAGASEAQELAAALSLAVTALRNFETLGIGPTQSSASLSFVFAVDDDLVLNVAKLRALRLLWSRLLDACDVQQQPPLLHAETSWRMLTRQDVPVNILRNTVAAFAAAIGGADGLQVRPFTDALGLGGAHARRVARNTGLILLHEVKAAEVADPTAGAAAYEAATDRLCEAAWREFQQLEQEGGVASSLRAGGFSARIAGVEQARRAGIEEGQRIVTGVTAFPSETEAAFEVLQRAEPEGMSAPLPFAPDLRLPRRRLAAPFERQPSAEAQDVASS